MKIPQLKKKPELKSCHNVTWEDNYSWVHQKNILEVLRDSSKLLPEVREYLDCKRAHLLAVPDSRRGARMLLVVDEDLGEVGGLLAQWNGDRPGFLRIDEVEVVARFPRTGMGKVDVAALRKMLS